MMSVKSLAVLGFAATAQAAYAGYYANTTSSAVAYTTITTDIYTTFCPEATTFTQGTKTYTATASETLTITDCPCTYSHPIYTPKPTPSTYVAPPPAHNATSEYPVWVTTTETVKTYTTYCPVPTTVVQGSKTYTVTKATTLTVTDCPCTQVKTYPGTTTTVQVGTTTTYCPSATVITTGGSTYPVASASTVTLPVYSATVVPVTSYPATTPVAPKPTISTATSVRASATPTGPTQVTVNGAATQQVGLGAMVAGLIAMIL